MPGVAIEERSEVMQQCASVLSAEHELFAISLANGLTIDKAAVTAGFAPTSGYRLASDPRIQIRVSEALAQREAEGLANRAWLEAQMVTIVCRSMDGDPGELNPDGSVRRMPVTPDLQLAATVCMNLAKFKGFIVDKSSKLNLTADLSKLPPTQLAAAIDQRLQSLAPGARKKIEQLQAQVIEAEGAEEL